MTHVETVRRDTRSYRQGLVLGLTMAEVFLLLVFALLIALATLWDSEQQKHKALERQQERSPMESAVDRRLWDDVKVAIRTTSRDNVTTAIDHLRNGREVEPLAPAEKDFVIEIRKNQSGMAPEKISDQWRTLTRAARNIDSLADSVMVAEVVKGVLPDDKDRERVGPLIEKGLAAEKKGEHDWPPIINLSEARGYFFQTGKAELTPDFEDKLRTTIVPQLLDLARQFRVTTIEVVGHTDEQKIVQRYSNLDGFIVDVLHNTGNVANLIPADNAGLGLARATAVVRFLSLDERLKAYTLLPLSGGQLIGVDDSLTKGGGGDERERRRIEIRVRRANSSVAPSAAAPSSAAPSAAAPSGPLQPRVQTPPARPVSPRLPPRDRVAAPQWSLFGVAPTQPIPAR